MKVATTVEFTEADRRNVARFHGYDGLASHIQCVAWSAQQIRGALNVMAQAKPAPLGALSPVNGFGLPQILTRGGSRG